MREPVKYGGPMNKLIIHDNRVEIVSGCFPFKRRKVIPFSSIASVDTPQFLNKVIIHTNDGKKASFSVGNAKRIQKAILERM